jgi:hypothetical protein
MPFKPERQPLAVDRARHFSREAGYLGDHPEIHGSSLAFIFRISLHALFTKPLPQRAS